MLNMWLLNHEIGLNQKAFEVKSPLQKSKRHNNLHTGFPRPHLRQEPLLKHHIIKQTQVPANNA